MRTLATFSIETDLLPLTQRLWTQGISHQVVEEGDKQIIWLVDAGQYPAAKALCQVFIKLVDNNNDVDGFQTVVGEHEMASDWCHVQGQHQAHKKASLQHLSKVVRQTPTVSLTIAIALFVTFVSNFGHIFAVVEHLGFFDVRALSDNSLVIDDALTLVKSEPWRIVTPIFLHFSWLHIIFNALWIWELGRRIETQQGSWRLLMVMLVTGIAGNLAQAWVGISLFGGLSGVVYGLLGFMVCWDRLNSDKFNLSKGIVGFMLIWLGIGLTGVMTTLGIGAIANAAHLGGLLAGVAMGMLASVLKSRSNH